jgi:phospholipase C
MRSNGLSKIAFASIIAGGALLAAVTPVAARDGRPQAGRAEALRSINHIVVIYEENHSFDNLYGTWGPVRGQSINGLSRADAAHTTQIAQDTTPYSCLLQNDVNLTSPSPLPVTCTDPNAAVGGTAFTNQPFNIDTYIPATATTCPAPGTFAAHGVKNGQGLPGGCTEDLVHRFYQEQYQLDGGKQDRYVTGSDAVGLAMGYYDTTKLPIYQYLHGEQAPRYAIADNFFQGSFGGSFLNHQYLIAAQAPLWAGGAINDGSTNDLHSIIDANGMPKSSALYTATGRVKDSRLTVSCTPSAVTPSSNNPSTPCGDYAVNTIQPAYQPFAPGTTAANQLPPIPPAASGANNIGDALNARQVDWAWYSGGWSNAAGDVGAPGWTEGIAGPCSSAAANGAAWPNCPSKNFQYHHQPFNYFVNFAPGTSNRAAHLRDERELIDAAHSGTLKPVSFVKPIGDENEHPGYASEPNGSQHLVDLVKAIEDGPNAQDTLIVVTYDEFGGSWDHVAPPGQGNDNGPHDAFGPGTRVPTLLISPKLAVGVDRTVHDTTSILATIERRFGLEPLGSRDASVADLSSVLFEH